MTGSNETQTTEPPMELVDQRGPWPFVTRRVFRSVDQRVQTWSSRYHRKGLLVGRAIQGQRLGSILVRCLWMPGQLNWWISSIFALGSLLFAVASVLSLAPQLGLAWSFDSMQVNAFFFAGSIPFTIAAYLQLFQAANADTAKGSDATKESALSSKNGPQDASQKVVLPSSHRHLKLFGWRPADIGWLSCGLQFVGTFLFNFNTFDAMLPSLNWLQQDLVIWAPNIIGSILFLASGYLAFIETCHAYWAWNPHSISWWVVFTNLLGCLGFMISAVLAIVLPGTPNMQVVHMSIFFTLLGANGFLVGSLLMLPETVLSE